MTKKLRGASFQIRVIFQMSGLLSVSRSHKIQSNAASFGTNQSQIPRNHPGGGGSWVDGGNVTFSGGSVGVLSSVVSVSAFTARSFSPPPPRHCGSL